RADGGEPARRQVWTALMRGGGLRLRAIFSSPGAALCRERPCAMLKSLTLVSLLLSSTAYAAELEQDAPRPDAAAAATPARTGDKMIVTATRVVTTLDEVPASVTVLDKAAIDRAQDIGVAELLLRTPGVTISRNGGYGTATSLRIRGAEGDQTVVVIDGVKINDPSVTGGGFNFGNLLAGDAARIEV